MVVLKSTKFMFLVLLILPVVNFRHASGIFVPSNSVWAGGRVGGRRSLHIRNKTIKKHESRAAALLVRFWAFCFDLGYMVTIRVTVWVTGWLQPDPWKILPDEGNNPRWDVLYTYYP